MHTEVCLLLSPPDTHFYLYINGIPDQRMCFKLPQRSCPLFQAEILLSLKRLEAMKMFCVVSLLREPQAMKP